ncbi:MAG: DHH family phosphoesterase, partial [Phycisphaerae bacterium]
MCAVSAEPDLLAVADRTDAAETLLLVTHIHPDGDGLGAMIALSNAASQRGKTVQLYLPEGAPERYAFLIEGRSCIGDDQLAEAAAVAEAIVVLDTSSQSQLEAAWPVLQKHAERTVVIDHHLGSGPIGQVGWVDTAACSVGLMVQELLEQLAWPICEDSARALAVAIASDTGWMRFENTDARCLRALARLLDIGVRPDQLYSRLFQADRPQRLALQARALESIELHAEEKIGTMQLLAADFEKTGARSDETENLVNELLRVPQVEVAIMLIENGGNIRVNLRSRGSVDVSAIARKFGGGGHARAAGLRNQTPLPELKNQLLAEACQAL